MPLLSHHGHQAAKGTCASDDSGGPSHPPSFVVLRRTSLTLAQEKIVDEKVTDIQSDAPIFVAYMSMEIVGDNGTFSLVSFFMYPSDVLYHHQLPAVRWSCF
jgi:hypothetical protein